MVSAEKMTFSLEPNLYNFCYKFFFVHLMYSLCTLIFLVLFYSSTVFADSTHENKTEPQSGKNLNELSKKIDPTDFKNRFDLRGEYVKYNTVSQYAVVPRFEYAFSNSLAIRAEIPFLRHNNDPNSFNGYGNFFTQVSWRALRSEGIAMVTGSSLSLNTASNASLGLGKHILSPFIFWSLDIPSINSAFFPGLSYSKSVGGDPFRDHVRYTNLRAAVLTRWPNRIYTFTDINYYVNHHIANEESSSLKAELGHFVSAQKGFYIRPGKGLSGTDKKLGMKWSFEAGMRYFF